MVTFDLLPALLMCGIAAFAIVGGLYASSLAADRERKIIDLRHRVAHLQREYARNLAEIASREHGEVIAVPVEELQSKHAA